MATLERAIALAARAPYIRMTLAVDTPEARTAAVPQDHLGDLTD